MCKDNKPSFNAAKRRLAKISSQKTANYLQTATNLKKGQKKRYKQQAICGHTLFKVGNEFKTYSCNKRSCVQCQRRRTAIMYEQYSNPIKKLGAMYHVILTSENVTSNQLDNRVNEMSKIWGLIIHKSREQYTPKRGKYKNITPPRISGLRKLEIEISAKKHKGQTMFHPHYHIMVDSARGANWLVDEWLVRTAKKDIMSLDQSQKIVKFTKVEQIMELLKYSTKAINDPDKQYDKLGRKIPMTSNALNQVFKTFDGRRSIQPFGMLQAEKLTKEEQEKIRQEINTSPEMLDQKFKRPDNQHGLTYTWSKTANNWISEHGEILVSDLQIDEWTKEVMSRSKPSKPAQYMDQHNLFKESTDKIKIV